MPNIIDMADIVSEKTFMRDVIATAQAYGFRAYHTRDSRGSEPGFPDLVLASDDGALAFVELKRQAGRLTVEQAGWLTTLARTGADVAVWRPRMADGIQAWLESPARAELPGRWTD